MSKLSSLKTQKTINTSHLLITTLALKSASISGIHLISGLSEYNQLISGIVKLKVYNLFSSLTTILRMIFENDVM